MMRKGTELVWKQWFYCPVNMYTGVMLTHDLFLFVPNEKVANKVTTMLYEGYPVAEILESVTLDTPHHVNIGNVNSLTHQVEIIKAGEFYNGFDE